MDSILEFPCNFIITTFNCSNCAYLGQFKTPKSYRRNELNKGELSNFFFFLKDSCEIVSKLYLTPSLLLKILVV